MGFANNNLGVLMSWNNREKQNWSDFHRSSGGASLISVMVGVVMLAAMVVGVQGALENAARSDKAAKSSTSYTDVFQLIESEFRRKIESASTCLSPDTFSIYSNSMLGKLEGQASTTILEAVDSQSVAAAQASNRASAAVTRCESPTLISSPDDVAQSTLRFCLAYRRDATAPKGSFMESAGAFSEVTIKFVDSRTGETLSCNNFLSSDSSVAYVAISSYWTTKTGVNRKYRNQDKFFLVTRGN